MSNAKYVRFRRLFFIIMFLIAVPVIAVSTFYLTTHFNNKGVSFNSDEKVYSFKTLNIGVDNDDYDVMIAETDQLILYVRLYEVTLEGDNQLDQNLRYRIQVRYDIKNNTNINSNSVRANMVLGIPWSNTQTPNDSSTLREGYQNKYLNFESNIRFPYSPVFLVNIKSPVLYLELEYTYKTSLSDLTVKHHYKYNLANYVSVIDQIALGEDLAEANN